MELEGLSKEEFETYKHLLQIKRGTVLELANASGEKRTNLYRHLQSLVQKGVVSQIYEGKKHFFVAESPRTLVKYIENQQEKVEEILPELESLEQTAVDRPKIKFFEGKSSIKNLYKEILEDRQEILTIASTDMLLHTLEFHEWFVKERIKRKISARIIVPDTRSARNRSTAMSERKFAKDLAIFSSVFYVFGNKVATFSLKRWITVVVIENKEIAEGFRAIFEGYWKSLR